MPTWLPTLIFVPLIGFGLYRRFRRTFGRQLVTPRRMIARIVLLSAVCTLLLVTSSPTPTVLAAAAAGLGGGLVLAVVGLGLTKFEQTNEGRFYVPNGWIGIAVTALFLGRLAGRLLAMPERIATAHAGASPMSGLQRSPATLGLFFLLAGYYVTYYAGVLRKAATLGASPSPPPAQRPSTTTRR
jgi:hypothetical protein